MSHSIACPFCDGKAYVAINHFGQYHLECTDCLCDIFFHTMDGKTIEEGKTEIERTCRVVGSYTYGEHDELKVGVLSCGHEFEWNYKEPPSYCPNCGARVTKEDTDGRQRD